MRLSGKLHYETVKIPVKFQTGLGFGFGFKCCQDCEYRQGSGAGRSRIETSGLSLKLNSEVQIHLFCKVPQKFLNFQNKVN